VESIKVERAGKELEAFSTETCSVAKALLVIDLQNDYFPGGKFHLWNTDTVLRAFGNNDFLGREES
jgi:hypothetical protein